MACSVPRLFGLRDWFENRFGHLCDRHDRDYMTKTVGKWKADMRFVRGMWALDYRALAVLSWLAFQTPWAWWLWIRD